MPTPSESFRNIVEQIDQVKRHPVSCRDCDAVAGKQALVELIDGDVDGTWVCRDCR